MFCFLFDVQYMQNLSVEVLFCIIRRQQVSKQEQIQHWVRQPVVSNFTCQKCLSDNIQCDLFTPYCKYNKDCILKKYENVLLRDVNCFKAINDAKTQLNAADTKISNLVDNTKDAIQKVAVISQQNLFPKIDEITSLPMHQ